MKYLLRPDFLQGRRLKASIPLLHQLTHRRQRPEPAQAALPWSILSFPNVYLTYHADYNPMFGIVKEKFLFFRDGRNDITWTVWKIQELEILGKGSQTGFTVGRIKGVVADVTGQTRFLGETGGEQLTIAWPSPCRPTAQSPHVSTLLNGGRWPITMIWLHQRITSTDM